MRERSAEVIEKVRLLSRVSLSRASLHILGEWLVIAAAMAVSLVLFPVSSGLSGMAVYVLSLLLIATRQQSLLILTHDAIHKLLARTYPVNDFLGRYLLAFPTFVSLSKWRYIHLYHHNYTYEKEDPDVAIFGRYPVGSRKFRWLLVKDFFGLNVISNARYFLDLPLLSGSFNQRFLGPERAGRYAETSDMGKFWIFWAVVILATGLLFGSAGLTRLGAYWILPYVTILQVLIRFRGAIEHGNVPDRGDPYRQTRTYLMPLPLAYFLAPKAVSYHLEHHLYPSVPCYRLPELHRFLLKTEYQDRNPYLEPVRASLRALIS